MTAPLPEPALTIAQRGLGAAMYTEEQILNYGAAEYKRAILDAMNATGSFGKTGEVMAMVIRQLGAKS